MKNLLIAALIIVLQFSYAFCDTYIANYTENMSIETNLAAELDVPMITIVGMPDTGETILVTFEPDTDEVEAGTISIELVEGLDSIVTPWVEYDRVHGCESDTLEIYLKCYDVNMDVHIYN